MKIPGPGGSREGSLWLAWGVAGAAGLLAVLALTSLLRPVESTDPARVLRVSIAPPAKTNPGADRFAFESHLAVAPDGRSLAFVAGNQLWMRPLSDVTPVQIPGTDGAQFPFWSPDSETLGFFADGKLKRVPAMGGPVSEICDAPQGRGGSWASDGTILLAPGVRTGIFQVGSEGGEPRLLTAVAPPDQSTHRWPLTLPGGQHFLFLAASHNHPRGERSGIYVAPIAGGQPRRITPADSKPVVSAGRLMFLRAGDLFAQPFDLVGLKVTGEAVRIAAGVRYRGSSWSGVFSASDDDLLAYEVGSRSQDSRLAWIDRLGKEEEYLGDAGTHWDLRVSPDGDRLAVAMGLPNPNLWIVDLEGDFERPLALETSFNRAPVWSPDGERLAFAALNDEGRFQLFVVSSSGSGGAELLLESNLDQIPTSWSSDGEWLAFDQGPPGATEVWVKPMNGERESFPGVQTPPWAGDGQFSPDGRWLLYTSRESGVDQVYVTSFPDLEGRWQLSASAWARNGRWSPLGDKVFFGTSQAMLIEVALRRRKEGGLDIGMPRMLFSFRDDDALFRGHHGFYDVSTDGERFIFAQGPARRTDQGLIRLVLPWVADLEKEN